jgi:predicted amidohydrolase
MKKSNRKSAISDAGNSHKKHKRRFPPGEATTISPGGINEALYIRKGLKIMPVKTENVVVAAIQMASTAGDKKRNIEHAIGFVRDAHAQGAQIVCLPELFLTGYDLDKKALSKEAETADGVMSQKMCELSEQLGIFLVAPFPEKDPFTGKFYNSALIIDRGKVLGVHRKVYLWGDAEKAIFESGEDFYPIPSRWGAVGVLICADAEYPEPPRLLAMQKAKIVLVPSVWSMQAAWRWDIFLPAWALANLYYVIGTNTIGTGVRGGNCGKSKIVDPYGKVLREGPSDEEAVIVQKIDLQEVENARGQLPYMDDLRRDMYNTAYLERKKKNS